MTRQLLAGAAAGLLFGLGISLSGMINPAKVIGFFDVTGHWDASLVFVMAGAVATTFIGYRLVFSRWSHPLLDTSFHLPEAKQIDGRLLSGAAIFGIGWGIVGFCPGRHPSRSWSMRYRSVLLSSRYWPAAFSRGGFFCLFSAPAWSKGLAARRLRRQNRSLSSSLQGPLIHGFALSHRRSGRHRPDHLR
ncbi:YeeE/YedE family protein [Notoacmeibacter ruber]|uniref:YeeE/YedE family protein n=1 Tax=Notoacmeibacter ruber TaxID=2670375 RepID=UPI00315CF531